MQIDEDKRPNAHGEREARLIHVYEDGFVVEVGIKGLYPKKDPQISFDTSGKVIKSSPDGFLINIFQPKEDFKTLGFNPSYESRLKNAAGGNAQAKKTIDPALKKKLKIVCSKAEKIAREWVLDDPEKYGVNTSDATRAEIRRGTGAWVNSVKVHEDGYAVKVTIDTDDIGGSSEGYDVYLDLEGNEARESSLGKKLSSVDVYEGEFELID